MRQEVCSSRGLGRAGSLWGVEGEGKGKHCDFYSREVSGCKAGPGRGTGTCTASAALSNAKQVETWRTDLDGMMKRRLRLDGGRLVAGHGDIVAECEGQRDTYSKLLRR